MTFQMDLPLSSIVTSLKVKKQILVFAHCASQNAVSCPLPRSLYSHNWRMDTIIYADFCGQCAAAFTEMTLLRTGIMGANMVNSGHLSMSLNLFSR